MVPLIKLTQYFVSAFSIPTLTEAQLFDEITGLPSLEVLKKHLIAEGKIEISAVFRIVNLVTDILRKEENVVKIRAPITGKRQTSIFRFQILLE